MQRTALVLLFCTSIAAAQKDPVLYEYPHNLKPYTHFCLAADAPYPHEMSGADVRWIQATIRSAVKASRLPVLPVDHPQCAPMRLKASDTHLMLFVELAPSGNSNVPWPLQLRVTDPHLLGANQHVYQPILWELRQHIGPSKPKIARDLKAALTWLSRAWKTAHHK